jgi:predicted MPP superfamily phosphohydrolase
MTRRHTLCAVAIAMTLVPAASAAPVTGVVFLDRNGNGARDAGEPGVAGVAVSNQRAVVKTDATGKYELPDAGYGVVFVSLPRGHRAVGGFWHAPNASGSTDFALLPAPDAESYSFVHASDTHVSEASVPRMRLLGEVLTARRPDFVLVSGDLVKDALRVGEAEASGYYALYTREIQRFPVPVWSGPGNHEIFGIERHQSLVSPQHPLYGKGMYRRALGPNYYSFNWGRIHFIALDTVDIDELWYYGHVDAAQLAWLEADLAQLATGTTVVTFNHIPLLAAGLSLAGFTEDGLGRSLIKVNGQTSYRHVVSNPQDVLLRLKAFHYPLALGGHLHAFERVLLQTGPEATRFHLAAAVVGPTPGTIPSPSGVTLYRVKGDVIDDGEFLPLDR